MKNPLTKDDIRNLKKLARLFKKRNKISKNYESDVSISYYCPHYTYLFITGSEHY